MSKMAIPTMDVVRFKEDDIIVASGEFHTLQLPQSSRFLTLCDMTVNQKAYIIYGDSDEQIKLKDLKHDDMFFEYNGVRMSVFALTLLNNKNKTTKDINGRYNLTFVNNEWTWVHQ